MIIVEMAKIVIDRLADCRQRYGAEFIFGSVMVNKETRQERRTHAAAPISCFGIRDKFSRAIFEIAFQFRMYQQKESFSMVTLWPAVAACQRKSSWKEVRLELIDSCEEALEPFRCRHKQLRVRPCRPREV